jgi:uncharacterized integral membrane protein (TIGR00698 family)
MDAMGVGRRFAASQLWPGLAMVSALGLGAVALAETSWVHESGVSALTLAILLGIGAGHSLFPVIATRAGAGVDFAKSTLLRAGIVLYGCRITFHDFAAVGWAGFLIDSLMVGLTFGVALLLGTRVFKVDRQTAMLIGAGSAICGAAAVLAAEPVVRGQSHRVSVAVATVVVFGTSGMFLYPLLYPHLGLSQHAYGLYAGSTIHEVAQVVAAAKSVGDDAATTAVIEKMMRVMMLAPFLLMLSATRSQAREVVQDEGARSRPRLAIPGFALLFIAIAAVNSVNILPSAAVRALTGIDTVVLAMAMAALGLRTHLKAVRQAGVRPLLLAMTLFLFLVVGGYGVNRLVTSIAQGLQR